MKKGITIGIVILLALAFGYFLFKISPQQKQATGSGYNASLDITHFKKISEPPAFDPNTDHYLGNANAKNVFIEYGDLQCPYCAVYNDMLKQIPTSFTDTVFVFRYFPLTNAHQNSVEAALAAEAAGAQGKYWEMHDLLFQKQTDWQGLEEPLETFVQYAQTVGVGDIEHFKNDITAKTYLAKIQADSDQAWGLNLQGTPTYFFNNHLLQASTSIDGLKQQAQSYYLK